MNFIAEMFLQIFQRALFAKILWIIAFFIEFSWVKKRLKTNSGSFNGWSKFGQP